MTLASGLLASGTLIGGTRRRHHGAIVLVAIVVAMALAGAS